MKKAVVITAVLALLAGVGGGMWLKTQLDSQTAARAAQEQPQSKPEPSKYDVGPPDPQEMLELANEERRRVGIPPLEIDYNVQMSAQLKATDMRDRNYFSHNLPGENYTLTKEMALFVNKSCVRSGENITDNLVDKDNTSRQTIDNFIKSKPHYEAIIAAKYTKIGFGTAGTKNVWHFCEPN